jgi:thymidine kinase
MHSAKSQKLIDFIQGSREHGKKVVEVFKPTTDTRKGCYVTSRSSSVEIKAHCITEPREIVEHIQKQVDYVAIDEAQFLPREGMEEVVQELIRRGIGIVAAGLDMDFRGKPFGGTDLCMPSLLAQAEEVVKLKAFCAVCHAYNATMTQRLVNGQPAHYSDPLISVDDGSKKEIEYQPRCRGCHQIPD